MMTDPIADMLTRVRNASRARHTEVIVPASRTKREIATLHGKSFDGGEMAKVNGELGAVVGGTEQATQQMRLDLLASTPMGRFGEATEIGQWVCLLLDPQLSGWITGALIQADVVSDANGIRRCSGRRRRSAS